jgi:hypothetical protein
MKMLDLLDTKEKKIEMIDVLLAGLSHDDIVNMARKHVPAIYFISVMPADFVLGYAIDSNTLNNTMSKIFDVFMIDCIEETFKTKMAEVAKQ